MRVVRMMIVIGLVAGVLTTAVSANAASTLVVDADGFATFADCNDAATPADHTTIQAAIDAANPGDTIVVCAGTYAENVALAKSLTITGAQSGLDACEALAGDETIVDAGVGVGLTLTTGSAGSVIDGFSFSGGITGIESQTGPLDDLTIQNNRIAGFTGGGIFLNDPGIDVTLNQNLVDGSSKIGGGGIVHLDTDNFDGLWFTDNCIIDSPATGFFVDGNHNVGASATPRSPRFDGNLIARNFTGVNLGTRSFEFGSINGNTFMDNLGDGLQGGIQHSTIDDNTFSGNGRNGLAFTSFGNTGTDRGGQFSTVTGNCFISNGHSLAGTAGLFFSSAQAAGTISTNSASQNNFTGNTIGARYVGSETIDVEDNWWGAADGPSGSGSGSGDPIDGANLDYDPFRTTPATTPPCIPPDDEGPITTNTTATPSPIAINAAGTVTANVDDSTTGGSTIASAEYSLDGGSWMPMSASDSSFDEVSEDVTAAFTAPSEPGIVDLCVRGTDAPGHLGDAECTMLVTYDPNGGFVTGGGWIDSPAYAMPVWQNGTTVWQQGFEAGTAGWFDASSAWYGTITQVASGTGGIASANGSSHAMMEGDADSGPFSRFDMYRSAWPGTWMAEIDVYLDPSWAAGTGFDYSVAANGSDGNHQRDFIFHVAKDTSTGELFVAGSNNTNSAPREDLENINHYEVATAGWYTLQHVFRDQGGTLAVDLNLLDSGGNVLFTETRFNAADTIPAEVGGNRYSWFTFINVSGGIATDDHELWLGPTGRANFGFVSKYKKGASVPDGSTEFQFQAGNLNFHSSAYEWLVVNKASKNAQFKGTGTINGSGNYGFMLWATDGSPDTFRIKIWDKDDGDAVVYDNGAAQPIGGGSIVVHTK